MNQPDVFYAGLFSQLIFKGSSYKNNHLNYNNTDNNSINNNNKSNNNLKLNDVSSFNSEENEN